MPRISINGVGTDQLSILDRGFQYGDGVFETIAYENGQLQFWDDHVERLQAGARTLGITPAPESILLDDIKNIVKNNKEAQIVKIMLTAGCGERGYKRSGVGDSNRMVIVYKWNNHSETRPDAKLRFCSHTISENPSLSGLKHLNRLDSVLARNEWNNEYDEGLMQNHAGHVIEGTMSNIFAIKGEVLYTPELGNCGVEGIIRKHVLLIAKDLNMSIQVINIKNNDLLAMDELFITNSIIGIWPVSTLETKIFNNNVKTMAFIEKFEKRIATHAKIIS